MKNIFVRSCMLFTISMLITACGISKQAMIPSTALSSNNFTYVRDVSAKISHTYVLGIGGLREKDVIAKLTENANLLPGEALVNVGVRTKFKGFFIVMIKEFIATGQVVRFTDGVSKNTPEFEQAQEKYEALAFRMSGYDGDLLSALPISSVNVQITGPAENALAKYGVSLTVQQIENTIVTSISKKKISPINSSSDRTMDVAIIRFERDGCIRGLASIKDKKGTVISSVLFEGTGRVGRTPENLFLDAVKNASNAMYGKWYNLYDIQQKQSKKGKTSK